MAKYQQYEQYKESGVEWLGFIPKDWNIARVKNQFDVFNGSTPKSGEAEYWEGNIVWVTPSDLSQLEGYKISESSRNITTKGLHSCGTSLVPKGSMILSCRAPIGSLAVAGTELCTNQGCKTLVPTSGIPVEYYYYYFSTVTNVLNNLGRGSTFLELSTEDLTNLAMPLPSISESYSVVAFLDHETAQIDTLIEKQQTLIQLLKEKRQAVISHAVTKGLNPDAPMKDSGVEWLGEVPEHWRVLSLKHLISSLDSGCSVNAADTPAQKNEIGVLKTSCVYTRTFRVEENKTVFKEDLSRVKCPIRKGAIIISRMNTPDLVGASAIIDIDADNIFLPDRLWQTNFNNNFDLIPEFLAYFMTIKGFRSQISLAAEGASSSMQSISKEDYLSINCILPPIEEQQEIVEHIEKMKSKFNHLVDNAEQAIQLMQERRTALISAAVTGKIDVRGWVAPE